MSMLDNSKLPTNFDETLIDLVRLNPVLFVKEKRVRPYESMKEKHDLWKSIATSLGVEPNICMVHWKHLVDKYRREKLNKKHGVNLTTDWPLMGKMSFLDRYITHKHSLSHHSNDVITRSKSSTATTTKAEQIFGGVNYEFLPEAMEAQSSTSADVNNKNIMTYAPPNYGATNSALVRMKALLEGLDPINRSKAEKRILSYLCKCQLKTLENESIDDINF